PAVHVRASDSALRGGGPPPAPRDPMEACEESAPHPRLSVLGSNQSVRRFRAHRATGREHRRVRRRATPVDMPISTRRSHRLSPLGPTKRFFIFFTRFISPHSQAGTARTDARHTESPRRTPLTCPAVAAGCPAHP